MSSSSSGDRGRRRWGRVRLPIACATVVVLAALVPAESRQAVADPLTLTVEGAPLADVVTSDLELTPAFSPATTEYVLRCRPGVNTVGITLAGEAGAAVSVGAVSGPRVSTSVQLVENQALVIVAPGPAAGTTTSYWIRCLPSDFPALTVTRPGNPPPGWYLTGNLGSARGSGTYAMILDANGTPIWYQRTAGQGAINVTPLAKNVAAWSSDPGPGFGTGPNAAFSIYDLSTQQTRRLTTPTRPLDFHELLPLANGNYLLLASPLRAATDLRSLGLGRDQTIVDCVVEEVTAAGGRVWKWRASDHLSVAESLHPFPVTVDRQLAYDVFHCNSIDQDPSSGDLLLSPHSADAVYRIKRSSGAIIWKLGGNSVVRDGEQHLEVRRDPEGTFHGQHDARFQPGNNISLFDNHTWYVGAARGVEYHVDTRAGTATLVWEYRSPDHGHSVATGSFRRYHGGNDNLVTWGFKANTLFTEVDGGGSLLLNVAFPNGEAAYRTIKAAPGEFDTDVLRRTAGLPSGSSPPPPRVFTVGVASSGPHYGSSVTITGADLASTTAVRFGSRDASSFTVESDSLITAVAPAGSGTVDVTVTTPGGTTGATPANVLVGSDATFAGGIGSWKPNVNASVALSSAYARSRPYSLALTARKEGLCSALTSAYSVAGNAVITGSLWARVARGGVRTRSALIFYDSQGSVIWIEQGRAVRATDRWVRATASGTSPAATASVALAVDGIECGATLHVDDAAITGRKVFAYRRSVPGVSSVGPDGGTRHGGTVVTITGSGLSTATAVRFGAFQSPSVTIASDNAITAVSPPGSGTVDVVVTTRSGSLAKTGNVLNHADSSFENGPGSWIGNVNASTVSAAQAKSGRFSLQCRPRESGYVSVVSGASPAVGSSLYRLALWVRVPGAVAHVRPFMIFYGRTGEILSIEQGPVFARTSARTWTRLQFAARSPEGTAAVAVGVDDADGRADLYVDDVSLTGSIRFTYR
jgi:Arylsulfotransferase (ASST)/IPT/TIG domain